MIDKINTIKGYFKLETFDIDGNLVDTIEDNNLIMDFASISMAELISGVTDAGGSQVINKFVIGTNGHVRPDVTALRIADLTSDRTMLFSEDTDIAWGGATTYNYPIVFTNPTAASGGCTVVSEPDSALGTSTVIRTQLAGAVTYEVTLPLEVANGDEGVDPDFYAPYTEAALYCDTDIFSMKLFNGKIKEGTVSLKITWTITF